MALHNHPQAGARIATQTHWEIDPENTSVQFIIGKIPGFKVGGRFGRVRGSTVTHDGSPAQSSIDVKIDAASIDTGIKVRDVHLRTAGFLDVKHFPSIVFRSTRIEDLGRDRFHISGDLTIRGLTRQVVLDATVDVRDLEQAKVSATTVLDRRDFKIGPKPMGLMVGNDVVVQVALALHAH